MCCPAVLFFLSKYLDGEACDCWKAGDGGEERSLCVCARAYAYTAFLVVLAVAMRGVGFSKAGWKGRWGGRWGGFGDGSGVDGIEEVRLTW